MELTSLPTSIGHTVNLVSGTIVLGLQIASYRLFIIPYAPIRFVDIKIFSLGMKILQASYAADLLFGDLNPEVSSASRRVRLKESKAKATLSLSLISIRFSFIISSLRHCCRSAKSACSRPVVSRCSIFRRCWFHPRSPFGFQLISPSSAGPLFFTMANMLILQATTEQSTYLAMALFHSASFLKLQNHLPHRQRSLLKASWRVLTFTKFITFPQKIVPAVLCLTVLGGMWRDIDGSVYGRWWLGWSTIFISILFSLQVKFCDDVFPICN